jgi:hypothetical protein
MGLEKSMELKFGCEVNIVLTKKSLLFHIGFPFCIVFPFLLLHRTTLIVLSLWHCKLKLDKEKSKHASLVYISMVGYIE